MTRAKYILHNGIFGDQPPALRPTSLNNEAVIKMVKAGLSDDLISPPSM